MPSSLLILWCPLLLLPSIFPSIRVFSNEWVVSIRWWKYWSFSSSSPNEYSGLVSLKIDWFDHSHTLCYDYTCSLFTGTFFCIISPFSTFQSLTLLTSPTKSNSLLQYICNLSFTCYLNIVNHYLTISYLYCILSASVQFSCSVVSDSLPHHESQHARPPCHHQLQEFTQTHVHRVSDVIQPSHPLSSLSPPAPNPSQHQSLFQWVNSSHEVAKLLEFQL